MSAPSSAGGARTARGPLRVGELVIDPVTRQVRVGDRDGRAGEQGVRAAAGPGDRAETGLHEGGAAPRRLGLPIDGPDADARLSREPPAAKARPGGRAVRLQLLGRRLSPGRRVNGDLAGPQAQAEPGAPRAAAARSRRWPCWTTARGSVPASTPPGDARRGLMELASCALSELDGAVNGDAVRARTACRQLPRLVHAALERWRTRHHGAWRDQALLGRRPGPCRAAIRSRWRRRSTT